MLEVAGATSVLLKIGDKCVHVGVDATTATRLQEDPAFAAQFSERIHLVEEEPKKEQEQEEETGKWTMASTKMLMALRNEVRHLFVQPKLKKNRIWKMVADRMKENGYEWVTGSACDRKWRNLLMRYRKIKNRNKTGRERRSWEFYDTMDELTGDKQCSQSSQELLGSSMCDDLPSTSGLARALLEEQEVVSDSSAWNDSHGRLQATTTTTAANGVRNNKSESGRVDHANEDVTVRKRRLAPDSAWMKEYLLQRKEEERHRTEMMDAHWKEMQALEREKIEAVKALNNTLREFLNK